MLKRRALIRKLPAAETLGAVTVICSDKTGTLTANRMTVVAMQLADAHVRLDGDKAIEPAQRKGLQLLAAGGVLCNDAKVAGGEQIVGDPTETALVVAATRLDLDKDALDKLMPRVGERPFDSERKNMLTLHENRGGVDWLPGAFQGARYIAISKGAVDGLLHDSDRLWTGGGAKPLTPDLRQRMDEMNHRMAEQGMRVLGVALKEASTSEVDESSGQGLIFVGMVGMIDPPREEARAAVNTCKLAGIRPMMITGDHPATAISVAQQLGITTDSRVLTGQELNKLTDAELRDAVEKVSVYARVAPEHKLRVVNALQANQHVVAMTGDGVNDAPALKRADIGVSMGVTGADVTKETSDMVLLDDNFATIVAAVEEGRTIYNNVRRFVQFSVAGNIGKIAVMLIAPLLGMPIPLLPLQLLWLNLMTDGLLGLGMGVEPPERNVMRRAPRAKRDSLFAEGVGQSIVWMGALISLLTIGVGYVYWVQGRESWQTMMFCTLAFSQVAQAMTVRSDRESIFKVGLFTNRTLLGLALLVIVLQLGVVYLPFTDQFFHINPLTPADLLISVACGSVVLLVGEGVKWTRRVGMRRLSTCQRNTGVRFGKGGSPCDNDGMIDRQPAALMRQEIFEQPAVLTNLVDNAAVTLQAVAESARHCSFAVLAARGSSDNASTYGKYLLEGVVGLPTALAAPSLFTLYHTPPRLKGALVIGVSQSGQAADVVEVLQQAREQGAVTLAVTNTAGVSAYEPLAESYAAAGRRTGTRVSRDQDGDGPMRHLRHSGGPAQPGCGFAPGIGPTGPDGAKRPADG